MAQSFLRPSVAAVTTAATSITPTPPTTTPHSTMRSPENEALAKAIRELPREVKNLQPWDIDQRVDIRKVYLITIYGLAYPHDKQHSSQVKIAVGIIKHLHKTGDTRFPNNFKPEKIPREVFVKALREIDQYMNLKRGQAVTVR